MRILLTGGTGYLGGQVAARLAAAGHAVVVLCRRPGEARLPSGCRPIPGDILDPASLRRALTGCDALVHMAAMVRMWSRDPGEFDQVNVLGLAAVLRAAEEAAVPRIVYTSTIVALGPTDGDVGDEARRRTDFSFHTDYERTKWIALGLARERAAAGLPLLIVYPGIVYGPGAPTAGNLLRTTLADHLAGRLRTRLGRDDLRICYAYSGDVAEGHRLVLERGTAGRDYILGGENATQARLFAALQEITGRPAPRLAVPYWVAETAGRAQSALARATGTPPGFTAGVVATFRHEWAYSSDRAAREIGYRVTPLQEGLRMTLAALRAEREARDGS